jgi:hypothetical protein
MNPTENVRPPLTGHPTPVEVSAELVLAHHRAHGVQGTRLGTSTDAPRGLMGDLRHLQQQQEGTS